MKTILPCALFSLFLVPAIAVAADPLDDGISSTVDGDDAATPRVWRPQAGLGLKYDLGQGVTRNDREAMQSYRVAAGQGHAGAQFNLGLMYSLGQGVAQDYPEAMKWYRLASRQGHAQAQFNLGGMYAEGQGVAQDYPEAMKWYRLSDEQGNAQTALLS